MRKQYHTKKRACGLCKSHKKSWGNRWTHKDKSFAEAIREAANDPELKLFNEAARRANEDQRRMMDDLTK